MESMDCHIWFWIWTLQGPFLATFAMELGEHNAKKLNFLLKKNSLCGSILQSLFQIDKNWLNRISQALTAYVWGAAPCSSLPTADENAVTESAVTTVSSSLYQSATVLTKNEFFYSLAAVWNL